MYISLGDYCKYAQNEILLIPDEEVGKLPVREPLWTEAIEQKPHFKTGWLAIMKRIGRTAPKFPKFNSPRN